MIIVTIAVTAPANIAFQAIVVVFLALIAAADLGCSSRLSSYTKRLLTADSLAFLFLRMYSIAWFSSDLVKFRLSKVILLVG